MKPLLIIVCCLIGVNLSMAQFNLKSKIKNATDKIKTETKKDEKPATNSNNNTSTEVTSGNQNPATNNDNSKNYQYDVDGYIIKHPDIMNHLKTKGKYYIVTKFNNSNWSPFLSNDTRPYDYAYIEQKPNDNHPDLITHITKLVHKTKDQHPNLTSGSIIRTYGASYPIEVNKLYQCMYYIISYEDDGGIVYTELREGKTGTFFYLAPNEAAAAAAASKYDEYKKKSDQNVEKVNDAKNKKQDEIDLSVGTDDYNNYFKPYYKANSMESTLINVANNESVVIQSELKKYGKITIKKIALLHQDWEVIKNALGTPTHKQLECYGIGTTSTGKCVIKCITFMKKYEGGSSYSNTIHIESECVPKPISCDKMK